ncbi:hypothetical protein Lalb_Chr12g0207191 [Lupinus albus]|uniref:Uncharacterized protein n=1 Tax=Lupinus albus TaxID=3870 RepID=A0A6A4PNE5_LUPAL|nr:hypothetical protein Lalb_Chr12g0207191 [Lupinus albus]
MSDLNLLIYVLLQVFWNWEFKLLMKFEIGVFDISQEQEFVENIA